MGKRSVRVQGQDSPPPFFSLTVIERRRPSTHLPLPFSLNGFLPHSVFSFSHTPRSPPLHFKGMGGGRGCVSLYTRKKGGKRERLTYLLLALARLSSSLSLARWDEVVVAGVKVCQRRGREQ